MTGDISEICARDTVRAFIFLNEVTLKNEPIPDDLIERLGVLAARVWASPKPISVRSQHEYFLHNDPKAGEFREGPLVNRLGQTRGYPGGTIVPQLMVQLLKPHQAQLEKKITTYPPDVAAMKAWEMGAILRAIHPFVEGNILLSMLLENRMRLLAGLSLTTKMQPKSVFDAFRHGTFMQMCKDAIV